MPIITVQNKKTIAPTRVRILLCLMVVFALFAFGVPSISPLPASGPAVIALSDHPADQTDQDEPGATVIELAAEYITPAARPGPLRVQASRLIPKPALDVLGRSIAPPSPPPIG